MDKNKVLNVLKNNSLAVLSTADLSGKSESAIMAIAVKDNLSILMSTEETSRKIKNIKENNLVSVIVGGFKNDPSLQSDGTIKILENGEKDEAIKYMLMTHPEYKDYGIESGTILEFSPRWFRYVDYTQDPATEEIEL